MVMEWGMADQLGLRSYAGRPQSEWAQRSYSEDMARRLDLEVEAILQQQHRRAEAIVVEEAALLELIAAALLRYETVTGSELERLKAGCAVADLRAGSVGLEEGLA